MMIDFIINLHLLRPLKSEQQSKPKVLRTTWGNWYPLNKNRKSSLEGWRKDL